MALRIKFFGAKWRAFCGGGWLVIGPQFINCSRAKTRQQKAALSHHHRNLFLTWGRFKVAFFPNCWSCGAKFVRCQLQTVVHTLE